MNRQDFHVVDAETGVASFHFNDKFTFDAISNESPQSRKRKKSIQSSASILHSDFPA